MIDFSPLNLPAQFIESFHARGSQPNTAVGHRKEWIEFLEGISAFFDALGSSCQQQHTTTRLVHSDNRKHWWLSVSAGDFTCYIPATASEREKRAADGALAPPWLRFVFAVSKLVPSPNPFTPSTGQYSDGFYPQMYARMTTRFRHSVGFEGPGGATHTAFIDMFTTKSTDGFKLDGNVQARIAFQMLQCAEVHMQTARSCELFIITNRALLDYQNKLHPLLHVHAARIEQLYGIKIRIASSIDDYMRIAHDVETWLLRGLSKPPIIRKRIRGQ